MRPLLLSFSLVVAGCGGVQRAVIGPPIDLFVPTLAGPQVRDPTRTARAVVRSDDSSVQATAGTLLATYESELTRFRGLAVLDADDPRRGRVVVDGDMTSLKSASRMVTAILQYEFLEVESYPSTRLEGILQPTGGGADECILEGTLELHGVRRPIAFKMHVSRGEGGSYRFRTAFDLDRRLFGIRQHDGWDWLNRNDIRVRLDLRAAPERVTVDVDP